MASNRVEVAANGLEDLANCRMVFACSGIDVQKHDSREIINALRHIERRGAAIGAICTGTYLLARAGLCRGSAAPSTGKTMMVLWKNSLISTLPKTCSKSMRTG